ncbi:putative RTA1 domain protein [Zalerion maritima]|uniref:RTA1 domain protein n=1 Tax=Zalerion maritima TaxID=339359 RepID=A0AAD5RHA9_9PEZI|nr:putative RTA1 domain protein [Zalerion maritima]
MLTYLITVLLSLFVYAPNKGAPVFFAVAFALSAIGHIWQCQLYKSWKLIGLHPICAVMFAVGYAMREYLALDNYVYRGSQNLIIYVLSQVFIYICPPLLELANYHVLGRIFYYVPYLAPLPPGRVLSIFGLLMIFVETLNALGVALSSNPTGSNQDLGSRLTIAALAIQLAVIAIFIVLTAIFHARCAKIQIRSKSVTTPLVVLYTSMCLILIRCIYRLVEHLGNTSVDISDLESMRSLSPVLRYEWYFFVFEGTLMLCNSTIWNVFHPGRFLPKDYHVYLSRDGMTEVQGVKYEDTRPVWKKVASAITFGFAFRKKMGGRGEFEELELLTARSHS